MDNTDQLLIRACKSLSPQTRIVSVYRRQYYTPKNLNPVALYRSVADILLSLVIKYDVVDVRGLITELNPEYRWYHGLGENATYHEQLMCVLISMIRHTEVSKFPGYRAPISFRRN